MCRWNTTYVNKIKFVIKKILLLFVDLNERNLFLVFLKMYIIFTFLILFNAGKIFLEMITWSNYTYSNFSHIFKFLKIKLKSVLILSVDLPNLSFL